MRKNKKNLQAASVQPQQVSYQTADEEQRYYEAKENSPLARIRKYDKKFTKQKMWQTYALAALLLVVLIIAFQLRIIPIVIIAVACILFTPGVMLAIAEDRYENNKFNDTTNYIEQMLYSFRRNSKILNSLEDTIMLFPEGEMHDAIQEAIDYLRTSTSDGNIYEEAFALIENHYECRRVKSLHRYMMRVEGVGGDHNMGIQALINDRRIWIDRIEQFRKDKSAILKDVIIATIFSSAVSVVTLYMLPKYIDAPHNAIIQAYATFYICVNLLNIHTTIRRLILRINDVSDEAHDKLMLDKLNKYKNYNVAEETKKAIPVAFIGVVFMVIGLLFLTGSFKYLTAAMGAFMVVFGLFVKPRLNYRTLRNQLVNEIEMVFPDWLLELSLLLQTDNLHVAIEKTIPFAPAIIRGELINLYNEIINDPTNVEPFMKFFDFLPLQNIHSSMKLLYSISEFGTIDEQKQIEELIQRNAIMMNRAEEHRNQQRLARVFMLKFVPMGTSTLKMIVDMGVFLVIFISSAMNAVK